MYSIGQRSERIVCLADMDCFFVEVERLHRPELRGKAVIIGGWRDQRGVVSACSYEARELGVRSGIAMAEAYRLVQAARVPFITSDQLHTLHLDGRHSEGGNGAGRREASSRMVAQASSLRKVTGEPPVPPHGTAGRKPFRSPYPVVFMHTNLHGNYSQYSQRVQQIAQDLAPSFRAKSVDEFEMDITGCEKIFTRDYGGIIGFCEHLRRRVRTEVGLPMSIGIAPSRIVAKMASRHAKPDGVYRVLPDGVEEFLAPHDIQAVPGIGPATAARLRTRGIELVGHLLDLPDKRVWKTYGAGIVTVLQALKDKGHGVEREIDGGAFGRGDTPRQPKSIGHESTFGRDVGDPRQLERTLWRLTEDACRRLRAADLRCRHVTVKVRYNDFTTFTHGGFLTEPSDADSIIYARVKELFAEANSCPQPLRLLGVRLERLSVGASQLQLFKEGKVQREEAFFETVDRIRDRHGKESVLVGPGVEQLSQELVTQGHTTAGVSFRPVEAR